MDIDDSQTPYNQSQLEQPYLNSQASKRMKLERSSLFWEITTSELYKDMIAKLLQEESVEAKDLEDVSGLSRSAALKRAAELVQKGVVQRSIKPGTQNRHKPPYIFSLYPEVKSQLAAWLQEKGFEWHDQLKQDEIKESGQDLQLNKVQLSPIKKESHQLDFSDELVKEERENPVVMSSVKTHGTSGQVPRTEQLLDNAAEQKQEARSKFDEESQSLEKQIGIILTKMAKEIEALRNRVAYLEQKLEQKTQDTHSIDFGQVLSILERNKNDKDTT
jgi:predicted transcriptional regulator